MNVLLNDGRRNERAREASDSGLGMGCVGEMVLLRLMVGGLEERPGGAGQGPREKTGVCGWTGTGSLFLPGCQATPMQRDCGCRCR